MAPEAAGNGAHSRPLTPSELVAAQLFADLGGAELPMESLADDLPLDQIRAVLDTADGLLESPANGAPKANLDATLDRLAARELLAGLNHLYDTFENHPLPLSSALEVAVFHRMRLADGLDDPEQYARRIAQIRRGLGPLVIMLSLAMYEQA